MATRPSILLQITVAVISLILSVLILQAGFPLRLFVDSRVVRSLVTHNAHVRSHRLWAYTASMSTIYTSLLYYSDIVLCVVVLLTVRMSIEAVIGGVVPGIKFGSIAVRMFVNEIESQSWSWWRPAREVVVSEDENVTVYLVFAEAAKSILAYSVTSALARLYRS
ncbi:hypothetical protein V1512DRAFT_163383 [Lipomyces arxii]|uniref:uncharacterized protein n=1 Tax=Lipomyces arxii TaxID=56418 RepID=UPI0034CE6DB4